MSETKQINNNNNLINNEFLSALSLVENNLFNYITTTISELQNQLSLERYERIKLQAQLNKLEGTVLLSNVDELYNNELNATALNIFNEQQLIEDPTQYTVVEDPTQYTVVEEPTHEAVEDPAQEVVEEPAQEVVEDPAQEAVEDPAQEAVVEELTQEVVEEPAQETVEEPAQEVVEELTQEAVVEELTQEAVEEPSQEAVEEPAQEVVEEQNVNEEEEGIVTFRLKKVLKKLILDDNGRLIDKCVNFFKKITELFFKFNYITIEEIDSCDDYVNVILKTNEFTILENINDKKQSAWHAFNNFMENSFETFNLRFGFEPNNYYEMEVLN